MGKNIKKIDISLSLICILIISAMLLVFPNETTNIVAQIRNNVMHVLTPFYLWLGFAIFIYCLFLSFSQYGSIKLGNGKPEYSFFHWFVMIFCTGMGSNLLYWSAIEWIYYYQAPPLGVKPFSHVAAELAVTYGGYHWGLIGWSIYAIGAVTLGLKVFNGKEPGLSLSDGCVKAVPKLGRGSWSRLIELFFLFGTIGGFVTMLSFVIPMYSNNLSILFAVDNNFTLQILLMLLITVIFTVSSWLGISKGIKYLSTLNIFLAISLLLIIFIVGPTVFIIKGMTNSIGYGAQNFIYMSLWTDFVGNSGFPEAWTAFYWAWWIGLAPSMWIFIAKISRGRSIREIILGVVLGGSLCCWLYFGVISNFGMWQQITGNLDVVSILNNKGPTTAVSELVLSLPGGKGVLLLWTVTGIIFLITTLDSGSYILALSTTFDSNQSERTGRGLRIFWSLIMLAIPLGLMYANAPMATLQASAVLTAVPISFITIIVIRSGYLYLKDAVNSNHSGKSQLTAEF